MTGYETCLVVLPTFNNAKTLARVLDRVKQHVANILVVNDGSSDETKNILNRYPDIQVIHFADNRGKGAALLVGMIYARDHGFKSMIAMDTDGQHDPTDLPVMIRATAQHPDHIIIGDRQLEQVENPNIPRSSRFGRAFSDFWVRLETGCLVTDTQSGFRVYPVQKIPLAHLQKKNYDFEIEVLVRSLWSGIAVRSVPINVFYPKAAERVSHFRPWLDNARLSMLHTMLCLRRILMLCGWRYAPRA